MRYDKRRSHRAMAHPHTAVEEQIDFALQLPTAVKPEDVTSGFRDPSFGQNKSYPVHRWVPWVAGFSASFVHDCLRSYIPAERKSDAWILDPFAGVGTTLVEGYLHGYNVLGFEINPYAVLATRAKLESASLAAASLTQTMAAYERFMAERCLSDAQPASKAPEGFTGRMQLYSPKVERKVLFTLDFINSLNDAIVKDLFKLAFGSVMVSFSNYTYEPSLTRRASVGKSLIEEADVAGVIAAKMNLILKDVIWMQDHLQRNGHSPKFKVVPSSILNAQKKIRKKAFVDLAVTSPPYLNN